jgi:hypothetical protein
MRTRPQGGVINGRAGTRWGSEARTAGFAARRGCGIHRRDGVAEADPPHEGLSFAYPRIDVLTGLIGVEFQDAWEARLEVELNGLSVPVLGRDHLIANKRATGRPRDLLDVEWLEGHGGD